jgi:hypothetical protein
MHVASVATWRETNLLSRQVVEPGLHLLVYDDAGLLRSCPV